MAHNRLQLISGEHDQGLMNLLGVTLAFFPNDRSTATEALQHSALRGRETTTKTNLEPENFDFTLDELSVEELHSLLHEEVVNFDSG